MTSLTPTPHDWTDEMQPEVCFLCGLEVGAAHLAVSNARGLEGKRICDVNDDCRRARSGLSRAATAHQYTTHLGPGARPLTIGHWHWAKDDPI